MAGPNTAPIYTRVGDIQWSAAEVLTANTTRDLTAGTTYTIFTADATNGGRVEKVRFQPLGTNVVTVGRIWLNNGATAATEANNTLLGEVTLPATTVSEVAALAAVEFPMGMALPPGYVIIVTVGTTVAAGFRVQAIGGEF